MSSCISFDSYIKPQQVRVQPQAQDCCISFDSYIKPQLANPVVLGHPCCISFDSYIKPQRIVMSLRSSGVVYLLTPTSNHNPGISLSMSPQLYIFWLLHQTTTWALNKRNLSSCISFDSYIKPQLNSETFRVKCVVYLLTPTSNHNLVGTRNVEFKLYIFWLLHQTTTASTALCFGVRCISFDSYIKPQLHRP